MREYYMREVIYEISNFCTNLNKKESYDFIKYDIANFNIENYSADRLSFNKYLKSLSSSTLNTLCAFLEFGKDYENKVLPINLTEVFKKFYLPYHMKINEKNSKEMTVCYLITNSYILPKYLNRSLEVLFDLKHLNLELYHDCGGYLYLDKFFGITSVDYNLYQLNLNCMKCHKSINKIVNTHYFKKFI